MSPMPFRRYRHAGWRRCDRSSQPTLNGAHFLGLAAIDVIDHREQAGGGQKLDAEPGRLAAAGRSTPVKTVCPMRPGLSAF